MASSPPFASLFPGAHLLEILAACTDGKLSEALWLAASTHTSVIQIAFCRIPCRASRERTATIDCSRLPSTGMSTSGAM